MKKQDLKYGNVVEFRNGKRGIFLTDTYTSMFLFFDVNEGYSSYLYSNMFKNNLENKNYKEVDIVKVYEDYTCSKVLWERPKPLLTDEEREYLKEIFKGLTCKVISIFKGNYYLEINLENGGYINLAKYNCMKFKFEGMETCRRYTLKELGLEG